jgi:predicted glycosyltransferase
MNVGLKKYLAFIPKAAIDISAELQKTLKNITNKNPIFPVNSLIDIAQDYTSNQNEEDLLKLITEYYRRKHISHTSM